MSTTLDELTAKEVFQVIRRKLDFLKGMAAAMENERVAGRLEHHVNDLEGLLKRVRADWEDLTGDAL